MNLTENFDQESFLDWADEFLPDFRRDIRKVDVPNSFSGVHAIQTLGESNLGVRLYAVAIDSDPAKRKVGLANESFSLLKNYGTPNAIIAYYSPNSPQWRLSLLTSTPTWDDGKIITKLSNPKRQSYVLGQKAKVKTPHKFIITKGRVVDFTDLKSRFSVEVVNKEFYQEISGAFTKLVGGTTTKGKTKTTHNALLHLPSVVDTSQTSLEFAVRLIGRIIFCWFLREKRSEAGLALMPKELLSDKATDEHQDYYHKILEPIFFEILNKPIKSRRDEFAIEPFSTIPYLNGGLFSPQEDDYYKLLNGDLQSRFHNTLIIPDQWFKDLFEVLETYNFTIDENTSFDEELSIDPEMLGRIFENLLAEINPETGESARKSTGSYYTPRVIVDYMVDESLCLYLKEKTSIDEEKLRPLISYDLEDDLLNQLSDDDRSKIAEALSSVKILDPACGSGAFPIGALQKIVFMLQQIDPQGQLWFKKQIQNTPIELRRVIEREFQEKNFDYLRKLGIIRENIYGVDIQPIATEISRLRCFLTLVVDERIDESLENRGIEPLPNLDFKFVTANTLIGLPSTGKSVNQMGLFEDDEGIKELREVREMFFNASGAERDSLKLQFVQTQNRMFQKLIADNLRGHADLTAKLTTWDPFSHKSSDWFDPEWMFGIKEGFDISIANPPYIEFKKLPRTHKESLENIYLCAKGKYDIYVVFIELASRLLNDVGTLCYICPTTFMKKDFGRSLRSFIENNFSIKTIVDFSDLQVFDSVTNYTGVFLFSKITQRDYNFLYNRFIKSNAIDNSNFQSFLSGREPSNGNSILKVNSTELSNHNWSFRDILQDKIYKKANIDTSKLETITECIFQGIASGKDEIFYINDEQIDKYHLEKPVLRKLAKGKDLKAYIINWSGYYVIYPYDNASNAIPEDVISRTYPNLYSYLSRNKRILSERGYFNNSNKKWYELWNQRNSEKFNHKRIMVPEISSKNNFVITDEFFGNTKTYNIIVKSDVGVDKYYLLGLLNSKLLDYLYKLIATPQAGGFYAYKTQFLNTLPIKIAPKAIQELIYKLVKQIIDQKVSGEQHTKPLSLLEKEIDDLVYKLYDLTPDEIKIVERQHD